jgi:hypothetical protein
MEAVKIFISYAHEDDAYFKVFKKGIENHSKSSKNIKWDIWTDKKIPIGTLWHKTIQEEIKNCDAAILLISANFLSSNYIEDQEFENFLQRSEQSGFIFLPILLSDCDFTQWPKLSKRQFFCPQGKDYEFPNIQNITYSHLCKFSNNNELIPNSYRETYHKNCVAACEKSLLQNIKSRVAPQNTEIVNEIVTKSIPIKPNKIIQEDELKGYSDVAKILQLYKPQIQFKEDKIEDKSQKIGYSLFTGKDEPLNRMEYYLYLYKGINQTATYNLLKEEKPNIVKNQSNNLIILISREKEQKNQEKRKNNIKDKFKPSSIYYIDEFIWKFCTPKSFTEQSDSKLLDINNFVKPRVQNEDKEDIKFDDLKDWLNLPNEQVLVLKGTGGIGKTTVAKYLADVFQVKGDDVQKQRKSLFIESSDIIVELTRAEKSGQELDIYSFYEADFSKNGDSDKLTDVLFKVNLDNGNLLVIIDGLDEIISKVPNFDVNIFLNSIFDSYNEIGNAKVIITCRNHFWDKNQINEDYKLKVVELLPFDEPQAKIFFNDIQNKTEKKVEKCIKIAKKFISKTDNSENNEFQPYVLDVIKTIIEYDDDTTQRYSFDSKYLNKDDKNDYIIYNVCNRETIRIKQISVDEQIKVFMSLSVKRDGVIPGSSFIDLIHNDSQTIDSTKIEALKSHPFISTSKTDVKFKYDFLVDIFKGIFLKSLFDINNNEKISIEIVQLIANNCWLNSNLTREVASRIKCLTDDEVIKIVETISSIQELEIKDMVKYKAISGIFAMALRIIHSTKGSNIEQNTKILKDIFENNNCIRNLYMINFSSYEYPIKFDLSDKTLEQCYLDNYSDFWTCKFNKNTRFIECSLYNLTNDSNKEIDITEYQFIDCKKDSTIDNVFNNANLKEKNIEEIIYKFLTSFFGLFRTKGRLEKQSYDDPIRHNIKTRYAGIKQKLFKLDELVKILIGEKIIIDYIDEVYKDRKLKISDEYKMDVTKFLEEGTMSPKINKVIKLLLENLT